MFVYIKMVRLGYISREDNPLTIYLKMKNLIFLYAYINIVIVIGIMLRIDHFKMMKKHGRPRLFGSIRLPGKARCTIVAKKFPVLMMNVRI